jgi:hypothetical protein
MYLEEPLPFIKDFVNQLDTSLQSIDKNFYLSRKQKYWIGFFLLATLVTNSVCWARFERISLMHYSQVALSWMFRHSKIPWSNLLNASIKLIISRFEILHGVLALDDSDYPRSKNAKQIYKLHKIKDKKSGGYILGQGLIMLTLVSDKITIPIGFEFYAPDPEIKKWEDNDVKLKKQGVKKKDRPKKPLRNSDYPTKESIALNLLSNFSTEFPSITICAIDADALYGTNTFMNKASSIFGNVQVISQLRKNQLVEYKNEKKDIETLFRTKPFYRKKIKLRGKPITVSYCHETVKIKAHGWAKRKIVAIKYEDEQEYRYLVVTDSSWEAETIIQTYSLRWLIEVFFQDWKSYEGWGQLAKHTGYEGSIQGLILSLLLDHCLLFHPEQTAQIKDKLPVFTTGSLREKIIIESLIQFLKRLLNDPNPKEKLEKLAVIADDVFKPNFSSKHMNTVDMEFILHKKCA